MRGRDPFSVLRGDRHLAVLVYFRRSFEPPVVRIIAGLYPPRFTPPTVPLEPVPYRCYLVLQPLTGAT